MIIETVDKWEEWKSGIKHSITETTTKTIKPML
jgi:hypothetical protein